MGKPIMISWEDIVFENRNKDYGAYALRYSYPYYLTFAVLIVITLFLSIMFALNRSIEIQPKEKTVRTVNIIGYTELEPPPLIEKIQKAPKTVDDQPKIKEKEVVQQKIEKYVVPEVVVEEVKEEEEMLTMDEVVELLDTDIDFESFKSIGIGEGFGMDGGSGTIFMVVLIPPQFPGGNEAMLRWLAEHGKYPKAAAKFGIEGAVKVEFTVGMDGKLSEVTIVKGLHELCDEEAIRLIKSMPNWTPGISTTGEKVVAKHTIYIDFILD
jgi:protein TonB